MRVIGEEFLIVLDCRGATAAIGDNIVYIVKCFGVGIRQLPSGVKIPCSQIHRRPAAALRLRHHYLYAVLGQKVDDMFAQLREDVLGHTAGEVAHPHLCRGTLHGLIHHRNHPPQETGRNLGNLPAFAQGRKEVGQVTDTALSFGKENPLEPGGATEEVAHEGAVRQEPAVDDVVGEIDSLRPDLVRPCGNDCRGNIRSGGAILGAGHTQGAFVQPVGDFIGIF